MWQRRVLPFAAWISDLTAFPFEDGALEPRALLYLSKVVDDLQGNHIKALDKVSHAHSLEE